jgi:protein-L-isoaspartate(D-aspartate) O-methyltransferase
MALRLEVAMVEDVREKLFRDLEQKGIHPDVVSLMRRVPREAFVPIELRHQAHEDHPLPIGSGQTISQPYIVGLMTQTANIESHHRVLEVGTGSGYQTAVLAEAARDVYTIEVLPELLQRAYNVLSSLGYKNVHYKLGDGTLGWDDEAPFDRIVVTAAAPEIPRSLMRQLAPGGRMVIPVGAEREQQLKLIRRDESAIHVEDVCPVMFVPLIGKEGYRPSE